MMNEGPPSVAAMAKISVLILLACVIVACRAVNSAAEVTGLYELRSGSQKITLAVRPDERFRETILFGTGLTETREGAWHWAFGGVSFEGLWVPESFAPDYIRRADSKAKAGQPRYTEPGHWSIKPEKHWGKTILPVFPDDDLNFEMVQSSSGR
jgi:hypothetical protein